MKMFAALAIALLVAAPVVAHAAPDESSAIVITHSGAQPSMSAPPQNFTGTVRVDPLFQPVPPSRVSAGLVTFEPGARTAWHTHPLGQTLIVTAGRGWVQEWGHERREIVPGDIVTIPPGVKHWHGATATTGVSHIAIQESEGGRNVDWLEKVTDDQYGR
jgi:quercetin dioxygenase-like cupin family protein